MSKSAQWSIAEGESVQNGQITIIYREESSVVNNGKSTYTFPEVRAVFNTETGKLKFADNFNRVKESYKDESFNGSAVRKAQREIAKHIENNGLA